MENLLFEAGVMGSKVVKQFRLKGIYNTFMKGGGPSETSYHILKGG